MLPRNVSELAKMRTPVGRMPRELGAGAGVKPQLVTGRALALALA
jgi:hypothetical protein